MRRIPHRAEGIRPRVLALALLALTASAVMALATARQAPRSAPPTPAASPAPAAAKAHLWLDTDGGACVRSGVPAVYSDLSACPSVDAAYDASRCGDTVLVRPGRYADGTGVMSGNRTCTDGQPTLFAGEPGARRPILPAISNLPDAAADGPDWMTFRGFDFAGVPRSAEYVRSRQGFGFFDGVTHVTVEDVGMGSFFIGEGDVSDITIRDSDIGPCEAFSGSPELQRCGNNRIVGARRVLIEGNDVHDFRYGRSCYPIGPNDCHFEAMFIANGTSDVVVRGNRFSGCGNSGCIFVTIFGSSFGHEKLVIENNWFEAAYSDDRYRGDDRKAVAVSLGHCEGTNGIDYDDVWIRFNSFSSKSALNNAGDEERCEIGSGGYHVVGNIFGVVGAGSCASYIEWTSNLWAGDAGCGDRAKTGVDLARVYVRDSDDTSKRHALRGPPGSTEADDHVDPGLGCPAIDFDGNARPAGPRCDAGADER